MVQIEPVEVGGRTALGIVVELPQTRLTILAAPKGYIMCGALDVKLLDERLGDRRVVAGRALGVRSIPALLDAPLEQVTAAARERGVAPGMKGRDALLHMFE